MGDKIDSMNYYIALEGLVISNVENILRLYFKN